MPEGDTIFRTARRLDAALRGKTIVRFETAYAQLARVDDDAPLVGRTVLAVESRGKHCLVRLSGDLVLRTHLRMHGAWHLYRPGERWLRAPHRMRVLLAVPDFVAVAFDVPVAELRSAHQLARDPALATLGPDLLAEDFDLAEAVRRARGGHTIGETLLDQRVVAGIGNVYRAEVLFLCGVHPDTPLRALDDDALARILREARRLLRANAGPRAGGRITTYAPLRRTTGRADPAERLWVYGRGGAPCRRCATPVAAGPRGLGARIVYWCPRCQPAPPEPASPAPAPSPLPGGSRPAW